MEVFVTDHPGDRLIILVSGRFRKCKDVTGIEDIETFIFHGPHIEILDRNNVETIKVILPAIAQFVPAHCLYQRIQRVTALSEVSFNSVDPQSDIPTTCGCETILDKPQIPCDQCKQIAGFRVRVVPRDLMTAVWKRFC